MLGSTGTVSESGPAAREQGRAPPGRCSAGRGCPTEAGHELAQRHWLRAGSLGARPHLWHVSTYRHPPDDESVAAGRAGG